MTFDLTEENISKFLAECVSIMGSQGVITEKKLEEQYLISMSSEVRVIKGVVKPRSTLQVQMLVKTANIFDVKLYPISTGKNWGLGSSLPVTNNCVIVDLSEMKSIREVNSIHGYALVEPGVTQKQLADFLKHDDLPWILNVTGSGAETSIVGNVVEGGVGYHRTREEELLGMEVVLANGDILKTGFGHYKNAAAVNLYGSGIGPRIDGLFIQSNIGIVTCITLGLLPKQKLTFLTFSINSEEKLSELLIRFKTLRREGIIRSIVKLGNKTRGLYTIAPLISSEILRDRKNSVSHRKNAEDFYNKHYESWSAILCLSGSRSENAFKVWKIKKETKGFAKIRTFTPLKLKVLYEISRRLSFVPKISLYKALLKSTNELFEIAKGNPVDSTLPSLYWPLHTTPVDFRKPELTSAGMISYLPIIPLDGESPIILKNIIEKTFIKFGFEPNITFSLISDKVIWGVIDIAFDRKDLVQNRKAKECIAEVYKNAAESGIVPQRVGIDYMNSVVSENDVFWLTIKKIKISLDPKNILAPKRYNIL